MLKPKPNLESLNLLHNLACNVQLLYMNFDRLSVNTPT